MPVKRFLFVIHFICQYCCAGMLLISSFFESVTGVGCYTVSCFKSVCWFNDLFGAYVFIYKVLNRQTFSVFSRKSSLPDVDQFSTSLFILHSRPAHAASNTQYFSILLASSSFFDQPSGRKMGNVPWPAGQPGHCGGHCSAKGHWPRYDGGVPRRHCRGYVFNWLF